MRNISFRAKDADEAGKRLEEALNADVPKSQRLAADRMREFGDVLGSLLSLMPSGRQVAVAISLSSGTEEEDGDGQERVHVKVQTLTDRESGSLAQRLGDAESGDLSVEVSSGDDQHGREVAAAEQAERDRQARAAQSEADRLRNQSSTPGVKPGDVVTP